MKKIAKSLLIILLFFLPLSAGMYFLHLERRSVSYQPAACIESAEEFQNPYVGWYHMYGYVLSDQGSNDLSKAAEQEPGPGLALLEINLRNYINTSVSDIGLRQLDDIFAAWQAAGKQLIIRFLYDWDGSSNEPDTLELVQEHMSQTAEIVNRYSDCIYIIQGIYVGKWGEMHGSRYMNDKDMLTLIHHLNEVVHPNIFLSVRTPGQWRSIRNSEEDSMAQSENPLCSRLGLYNDGMLGSATDLGTYGEEGTPASTVNQDIDSRQAEIAFQNVLCNYVPNGGEVVNDNSYNDFPAAVADLSDIHVSYLNDSYDTAVLSKWERTICDREDIFSGMNGLDYISRHLGYRYVLRTSSCHIPESPENVMLSVVLENIGFSNCYRSFDVTLTLRHKIYRTDYSVPVQTDTRLWNAGMQTVLEVPLDISDCRPGNYTVYLKITDPASGYEILCANEGQHNEKGYVLGELAIRIDPIWSISSAP